MKPSQGCFQHRKVTRRQVEHWVLALRSSMGDDILQQLKEWSSVSMKYQWSCIEVCYWSALESFKIQSQEHRRPQFEWGSWKIGFDGELDFTLKGTNGICMDRMQPLDNWQWAGNGACHLVIVGCIWSSIFRSSILLQRIVRPQDRVHRRALVNSCYYTSWAWSRALVTSCYHSWILTSTIWSYREPRVSIVEIVLDHTSWTSKSNRGIVRYHIRESRRALVNRANKRIVDFESTRYSCYHVLVCEIN